MTFKNYLKLLFHALVAAAIILVIPVILCVVLYPVVPVWVTATAGIVTGLIAIYPAMKYIEYIVNKDDLFEGMF